MKDFMIKLFKNEGMKIFEKYVCDKYDTVYVKEPIEEAYYLNVFITKEDDILKFKDNYELFYDAIKSIDKQEYEPAMDKNTSCIIYYCVSNEKYKEFKVENKISNLEKIVCDIEEDLYYFKKNVFVYSEDQLNYIKDIKIKNFNEICNDFISKRENFDKYKKENINFFEYDLIMNMFIKFPFLNYTKYFKTNEKSLKTIDEYTKIELFNNNFSDEKQRQCEAIWRKLKALDDNELDKWLDDFGGVIK